MDDFDLYNIAEIRFFLMKLGQRDDSPIISKKEWSEAKSRLWNKYQNSTCISIVMNILKTFEETNVRMYRSDLEIYLHESKLEDFYESEQGVITVSTMHKSKGREFDNVFILLNKINMRSDEEKRKLYVGMTRGKNRLHVHYCGKSLDLFAKYADVFETDMKVYSKPREIILQLSHKDVFLDFFKDEEGKKDKKRFLSGLQSGMHLIPKGNRLYIKYEKGLIPIVQFSVRCNETVKRLAISGYMPYDATIRFICGWKAKGDLEESVIVLADVYLKADFMD